MRASARYTPRRFAALDDAEPSDVDSRDDAFLHPDVTAAMRAAQGADPPSPELTAIANTVRQARSGSTLAKRMLPAPSRC